MLELLRNWELAMGQLLQIFLGFAVVERVHPAERGQPLRAYWFNVKYVALYQLINLLLLPLLTALVIGRLSQAYPGAFGLIRIDGFFAGAWKILAFLFVYDFFYYWFHRLQHASPFLWAQHELHHSEESLNVTTALRHHWLEDMLRLFFVILPMSLAFDLKPAFGGWAFVVGLWPVFIHANLRLRFGPLSRVLGGPQVHRIHHSLELRHQNRNFANFALWDQIFGTYYHPGPDEYPRTGLASGERVTTIAQALWLPFGIWFKRRPKTEAPSATARPGNSPTPPPAKTPVVLAAWGIMIVLTLFVLEVVARVVFPLPALANFNRIEYTPAVIAPGKNFLMNSTIAWTSEPDHAGSLQHLNLYGFRDVQWDVAHKHAPRILFVGDSFVEGFMAADDETIPALFARRARAAGQALEVFNLGVGGTDLPDYLKLIQDAVPALLPDEVILVFYANDFAGQAPFSPAQIRPLFESQYRPAWLPRSAQVVRRLIAGEPVPRAWHGPAQPFFAAVPDPSNPWTQHAAELAPKVDPDIADAMRRGTFNPYAVDELAEYAHYFKIPVDVSTHLSFLRDFLAARKVRLRLAYIPYPAQVSDYYVQFKHRFGGRDVVSMSGPEYQIQAPLIAEIAGRLAVPFLDLTPLIRAREDAGEHLYWDYDHHFRPAGYALAADALYSWATAPAPDAPTHKQ